MFVRLSILPVLDGTSLRDYAISAIRDWVPWRLLYNMLLAVVVVVRYRLNLPSFKAAVIIDSALWLFPLAVLAEVAYCAAYVVDIFVHSSGFPDHGQRFQQLLFALGVAFAAALIRYFSIGYSQLWVLPLGKQGHQGWSKRFCLVPPKNRLVILLGNRDQHVMQILSKSIQARHTRAFVIAVHTPAIIVSFRRADSIRLHPFGPQLG